MVGHTVRPLPHEFINIFKEAQLSYSLGNSTKPITLQWLHTRCLNFQGKVVVLWPGHGLYNTLRFWSHDLVSNYEQAFPCLGISKRSFLVGELQIAEGPSFYSTLSLLSFSNRYLSSDHEMKVSIIVLRGFQHSFVRMGVWFCVCRGFVERFVSERENRIGVFHEKRGESRHWLHEHGK